MSQDDDLSNMLGSFMHRLRRYLEQGGPDDVIDRILAAVTVGAAALMILWSPNRKVPGFVGIARAVISQIWGRRHWLGVPQAPPRHRDSDYDRDRDRY